MSSEQEALFINEPSGDGQAGPVTCLDKTFDNDTARREYYIKELKEKLQDPEFRKIEGFPIGEDEDILNLSDPPFYTACPNPWISEFIEEWEQEKPKKPKGYQYHREPFAADVSEGKGDPIYKAHSYHTKVPHKAIMRYLLHYTEPGDIVFDGFAGTGMTGVAAQACGDRSVVLSLGYQVKENGVILKEEIDENQRKFWKPFSKLGSRRTVMNDLSPAATFIAYNYNTPVDVIKFEKIAQNILSSVEQECGWMYETLHTDGKTRGTINYTVWSDVFRCPDCSNEIVYWKLVADVAKGRISDNSVCPKCQSEISKRNLDRAWITEYDSIIGDTIRQAKQVPVLINYSIAGNKGRLEKVPDQADLKLIEKIESINCPYPLPDEKVPLGDKTGEPLRIGITHAHHFYTKRNRYVLSALYEFARRASNGLSTFFVQYATLGFSKLARYVPTHFSQVNQYLSGTLYIGSLQVEVSPDYILNGKLERLLKREVRGFGKKRESVINTGDASQFPIMAKQMDYIFIDPPFGANLNYSELNFLWESWLKIWTDKIPEAIENKVQGKGSEEYRDLMKSCFVEAYRILKPGRWMTVEFSNTRAAVWNSIQTALGDAGFIVANVSALDKKQGSFNAVTNTTSVKQDLVISAYKPNGGFEERFQNEADTEAGVWDFVRTHLQYLPVTKQREAKLLIVTERDPRILFDQMVAYYVRKGFPVPLSSQEFQRGLALHFIERDGMYFLPNQVAEYDRKMMSLGQPSQESLFVSDEPSAIQWLRKLLKQKPQTFSEVNSLFMKHLGGWSKNEAQLDLRELLNQNFISYDGRGQVPEQVHAYLSTNWKSLRNLSKDDPILIAKAKNRWYVPDPNKTGDIEKLRKRTLLKEFEEYNQTKKKLKVFRLEAVRAGFKRAWQDRDYNIIIDVAKKIPKKILEEDPKLLMWYDQAVTRIGGE
jgi:DNA modification methylase